MWEFLMVKLAVLSDRHPSRFPGAASVAYSLGVEASHEMEVEFWCSSLANEIDENLGSLTIRNRKISERYARKMEGRFVQRVYFEIIGLRELFWLFIQIQKFRPTHVWVHQIGHRFPKSSLLMFKAFQVSIINTVHDFGIVLNRKLYPSDFGLTAPIQNENFQNLSGLRLHLLNREAKIRALIWLRRRIVLFFYNLSDENICISQVQENLLSSFGLRTSRVIPNGTPACRCDVSPHRKKEEFKVLFAGRPHAKGLELLLEAVAENPKIHLYLAGSTRLQEIAAEYLDLDQFTYFGEVNQTKIFELIHEVDVVSVLSQCFDVYPTITLEALSHHTPVITTELTGNVKLVKPNLQDIREKVQSSIFDYPAILTPKDTWKQYKSSFN
jgi:glycosyltransferase involved in cell wall biosynthesis